MLDGNFMGYYIGGLRLNWNITGFYTYKDEKRTLALNQSFIDIQSETFLFNTNLGNFFVQYQPCTKTTKR